MPPKDVVLQDIAGECHVVDVGDGGVSRLDNTQKRKMLYWFYATNVYMITGKGSLGPSVGTKPATEMLSGFSSMQFDDDITCTLYKEDGTPLYVAPPIAPRSVMASGSHRSERRPGPVEEATATQPGSVGGVEGPREGQHLSNGMECWMCKELLPHVKSHECKEKCSSW